MSLVNNGKDTLREQMISVVSEVGVGTSNDATTSSMTSLVNEIISKAASNAEGKDKGESLHSIRLLTTEANGNTLREVGTKDGSGNLISRNVHADIDKTSSIEIVYEVSINAKNA